MVPVFHNENEVGYRLSSPFEIENLSPFIQEQQLENVFERMVQNDVEEIENLILGVNSPSENEESNLLFYHPVLSETI